MTIGILLVTHVDIGDTIKETAQALLGGRLPTQVEVVSVPWSADTDGVVQKARALRDKLNKNGVLVLADAYGATPANIAGRLLDAADTRVVCGLNLPMLLKALNYCHLELDEVTSKALDGGRDGIRECKNDRV